MSEEKLNLARLKKFGQNFEISVDADLALKFKNKEISNVSEVMKVEEIFFDAKKVLVASKEELEKVFQTTDTLKIAEIIVTQGEIQLSAEHRSKEREQRKRKLINMIHKMAIDPKTNLPHPVTRIEAALDQGKINLDDHKTVEEQFEKVISKLRPIIPVKIEMRKLLVSVPGKYIGKSNHLVRNNSKILKEDWNIDGSWRVKVEIPAGFQQEFIDLLNAVTHGDVSVDIENE
ncbi:ribosome assembly factor SBDS [archaeon]|jgi:ribosome maturation protein SDO1|nr:ribosome assembly factor SBDS [archaeon]MBT3451382.1 ribosome assembly factor SBDS [archaeon]MBT6868960.1 ribosome assembly factor SBDS [archaeon]MBT7193226.1 ribosome assembly factor SBDS [archaeon]MBT7380081.1 ribosome assembly factor SBDS [archaeon]